MSGYRAFVADDDNESIFRLEFYHNPKRWIDNQLDDDNPLREENLWSEEIKYINREGDGISEEILNLPNDIGGIYLFYIKGLNLPFMENYILYVGRCKKTSNQNIRKRAKEYYRDTDRSLIKKMFRLWKDYLYYRYFPDNDNDRIDKNEIYLIRALLPPFNERIPDRIDIQPTVSAFN